jgi:hypothetical protein
MFNHLKKLWVSFLRWEVSIGVDTLVLVVFPLYLMLWVFILEQKGYF